MVTCYHSVVKTHTRCGTTNQPSGILYGSQEQRTPSSTFKHSQYIRNPLLVKCIQEVGSGLLSRESMARSDLHPSQGPVPSYSSTTNKTSAAETLPNSYAAPTDPHSSMSMTKPLYDHPPAANDGAFFPIYPDFYDTSSMDYSAVAAANGQENPEVSASSEGDMPYPPGWDYGTVDVQMRYSLLSPGTVQGEEIALQPQAPWNYGTQAYPALVDTITGGGMLAMADHMSQTATLEQPAMAESMFQHALAEDSTNGCYDSLRWPYQPPMGQISPSPSQGSYYISSPASAAGAHFSRHNSCSSLLAARVSALEQTRFDARFHPVPDQAVSPGEARPAPGGSQTGADSYSTGQTMRQWGDPHSKNTATMTTTARDHDAGTVSPAMTPSPRDSIAAIASRPATKSARNPSTQQSSRTNKRKDNPVPPAQQTPKQKQSEAGGRSQSHRQQEHSSQAGTRAKGQAAAEAAAAAQAPVRHRNRDAANKCRAKTKKAAADLESTERAMSTEHRELSAVARVLRDEVLMLKNELLAHGSCDDDLIQQYLTAQARRVGYGTAQSQAQQQQQQQH